MVVCVTDNTLITLEKRFGWAFAKYIDSKYYWEIVVLLRKLCIGVVVSFLTVEPMAAIPLQFIVIVTAMYMQLRWRPYIAVKGRCGVCGSGMCKKASIVCCRGANNRIELILMTAESLLLIAGFANAAVGGGVRNDGASALNQTMEIRRVLAEVTPFTPANSAALKTAVGTCTQIYKNGYKYQCSGGCLGETADGSCPIFAAKDGNGVIGDWDVSKVTSLSSSM